MGGHTGLAEAAFGLFVEIRRQGALLGDGHVGSEVLHVRRAHNGARQAGVAEREAQDELEAAHVAQQFLHARGLPATLTLALGESQWSLPPVLVLRRGAPGGATPDESPGTRLPPRR